MSRLVSLPFELLAQISNLLNTESLHQFSLTNSTIAAGTSSVRFQEVHLIPSDDDEYPKDLKQDVDRLVADLTRRDSFRHVRRLKIRTATTAKLEERGYSETNLPVARLQSVAEIYADDCQWMPLAALLQQVTRLSDLDYSHERQLSPCVFEALPPGCRLHMPTFCLRSLIENVLWSVETDIARRVPPPSTSGDIKIDPYEVRLATSTNLYSLASIAERMNQDGSYDWNGEAVCELVTGLAPNLYACRIHCPSDQTYTFQRARESQVPRRPWSRNAFGPALPPVKHGRLGDLHINWSSSVTDQWCGQLTDVAALRALCITGIDLEGLQHLDSLNLIALEEFELDHRSGPTVAADIAVNELLTSVLPPLRSLVLHSPLRNAEQVETILRRHGPKLKKLRLASVHGWDLESATLPDMLCAHCPNLEDLGIHLTRTEGDAREIAQYRALGGLLKLQMLHIGLQCFQPSTAASLTKFEKRSFHAKDWVDFVTFTGSAPRKARNVDVRAAVVNAMVDRRLVEAICRLIVAEQQSHGTYALEKLDIQTVAGPMDTTYYPQSVWDFLDEGIWTCTPRYIWTGSSENDGSEGDGGGDGLQRHQQCLQQHDGHAGRARFRSLYEITPPWIKRREPPYENVIIDDIFPVLCSIWRELASDYNSGGNWWELCPSLPLQLGGGPASDAPRPARKWKWNHMFDDYDKDHDYDAFSDGSRGGPTGDNDDDDDDDDMNSASESDQDDCDLTEGELNNLKHEESMPLSALTRSYSPCARTSGRFTAEI